jgi:hypothetical protein
MPPLREPGMMGCVCFRICGGGMPPLRGTVNGRACRGGILPLLRERDEAFVGAAFCRPSRGGAPAKAVIPGLSRNPGSLVYHFWVPGQARNDRGTGRPGSAGGNTFAIFAIFVIAGILDFFMVYVILLYIKTVKERRQNTRTLKERGGSDRGQCQIIW